MSSIARIVVVGMAATWAAACSHSQPAQPDLMDRSRDIFLLLRYDANNDRKITRDEMEAGLKADYATADADHNGKLEPKEVQAENQRRWAQEGPQSSPLMDWNMDGNVDLAEFANAVRSLFGAVDNDKDGVVTVQELQAPRISIPPPPLDPNAQPAQTPTPTPGGGYPH